MQRILNKYSYVWKVLKEAGFGFVDDSCFRSSAALSFYTLISIAPLVLITISVGSIFVDSTVIRDQITNVFRNLIGETGAGGVFALMDTLRTEDSSLLTIVLGIFLLVFSATTMLVQVMNGFNEIFSVRRVEGRKGWLKKVLDRLVSMGLILSLGFAMIISLTLDAVIVAIVDTISQRFELVSLVLLQVLQNLIALGLVFIVLYSMFRWLSDVILPNRFLLHGAALTTIVLLLGKFLIGWYIGRSNLTALGGAASSIVVLMLWVYYSSIILFFGAELIKAQTVVSEVSYKPSRYARRVKIVEV